MFLLQFCSCSVMVLLFQCCNLFVTRDTQSSTAIFPFGLSVATTVKFSSIHGRSHSFKVTWVFFHDFSFSCNKWNNSLVLKTLHATDVSLHLYEMKLVRLCYIYKTGFESMSFVANIFASQFEIRKLKEKLKEIICNKLYLFYWTLIVN